MLAERARISVDGRLDVTAWLDFDDDGFGSRGDRDRTDRKPGSYYVWCST